MKVLITGAGGQLGRELQRTQPGNDDVVALTRAALDVTDRAAVARAVATYRPDWVINAAAYTHVDRAESDRAMAFAINAEGPQTLAEVLAGSGGSLLQVSTDFVFSGEQSTPYLPGDPVGPVNVYGQSKARGEAAVRDTLPERHLIVRTAWLYADEGRNFVATMLRLMGERGEVAVVDDQIGTPTRARGLAAAIWEAAGRGLRGTYHWTDAGVASWYDFACAIRTLGGLRNRSVAAATVRPIPGDAFPTPARRPAFSVLDKTETWAALDAVPAHWQENLRLALENRDR